MVENPKDQNQETKEGILVLENEASEEETSENEDSNLVLENKEPFSKFKTSFLYYVLLKFPHAT